jgi:hypothetical protein
VERGKHAGAAGAEDEDVGSEVVDGEHEGRGLRTEVRGQDTPSSIGRGSG